MIWSLFKRSKSIDEIAAQIDRGAVGSRSMSVEKAMQVTTVLACVDAIATGCAVPDLHVMKDLGGDKKEKAKDHPAYRLLHRRPNEFQTALEFREALTMHSALTGTGYAIPTKDGRGRLAELLPVLPQHVMVERPSRYEIQYRIVDEFGTVGVFAHDEMFVLRNRSWDLISGLSVIRYAREAFGLAADTEANIAALQQRGGKPGGILSTDSKLNKETVDKLKDLWAKGTTGKNAYKTPVLDNGLKYTPMGMSAVDQQTNETRRMQVEEICRAFGVFPQVVMSTDKASTFGSAEAFFAAHNRLTIGKWQKNWCEKSDEFILDGAGPLFTEFDNRALDGASLKDRGEYYARALGSGGAPPWMTQNEVRAERGLPPLEGGDELFKPTNAETGGNTNET